MPTTAKRLGMLRLGMQLTMNSPGTGLAALVIGGSGLRTIWSLGTMLAPSLIFLGRRRITFSKIGRRTPLNVTESTSGLYPWEGSTWPS